MRGGEKEAFTSVFHAVIHKKSKVKTVNLLCSAGTKTPGTPASFQVNQCGANEKGETPHTLKVNRVKSERERCDREMIYRFNDSAHYLF